MRWAKCGLLVIGVTLSLSLLPCPLQAAEETSPQDSKQSPAVDQAELDKRFQEMLTGVALVGTYTTVGPDHAAPPAPDRYVIESLRPLKSGFWLFKARIQYGGRDVRLPLTIPVRWAGETPVITMSSGLVPGMGTFTARILFDDGLYAGTWSAGDHGGHMYGKLEKVSAEELAAPAKPQAASEGEATPQGAQP